MERGREVDRIRSTRRKRRWSEREERHFDHRHDVLGVDLIDHVVAVVPSAMKEGFALHRYCTDVLYLHGMPCIDCLGWLALMASSECTLPPG